LDARKRPKLALRSALDRISSFPSLRKQFVETIDRVPVDHAREHVEIGVGLDVVKLVGFDQRTKNGCACRKLNPGILVMQPAEDWATKNVPGAIDGAREGCILLQG
jgi:hypothetical protein